MTTQKRGGGETNPTGKEKKARCHRTSPFSKNGPHRSGPKKGKGKGGSVVGKTGGEKRPFRRGCLKGEGERKGPSSKPITNDLPLVAEKKKLQGDFRHDKTR